MGERRGAAPGVDAVPVAAPAAEPVLRVTWPARRMVHRGGAGHPVGEAWEVTSDANRVGIRLDGPALERDPAFTDRELPSEGMVDGALQVPPEGRPVLFLADHPVTGGYPVIAIVADADLPAAAQLRPGGRVRFRRA